MQSVSKNPLNKSPKVKTKKLPVIHQHSARKISEKEKGENISLFSNNAHLHITRHIQFVGTYQLYDIDKSVIITFFQFEHTLYIVMAWHMYDMYGAH